MNLVHLFHWLCKLLNLIVNTRFPKVWAVFGYKPSKKERKKQTKKSSSDSCKGDSVKRDFFLSSKH